MGEFRASLEKRKDLKGKLFKGRFTTFERKHVLALGGQMMSTYAAFVLFTFSSILLWRNQ